MPGIVAVFFCRSPSHAPRLLNVPPRYECTQSFSVPSSIWPSAPPQSVHTVFAIRYGRPRVHLTQQLPPQLNFDTCPPLQLSRVVAHTGGAASIGASIAASGSLASTGGASRAEQARCTQYCDLGHSSLRSQG